MYVGWPKPSLFYLMIYSLVLSNPLFSFTLYILCNLFSSILYFQVMYVGVTYTGNGPYRSEVPAVSSRSLDSASLFQVNLHFCLCQWLCFGELFDSILFFLSLIWFNSEVFLDALASLDLKLSLSQWFTVFQIISNSSISSNSS